MASDEMEAENRSASRTRVARRLKPAGKWLLRRMLAAPVIGELTERAARHLARAWPDTLVARSLSWQVTLALQDLGDLKVRPINVPGGARLVVRLNEYSWRRLYFQLSPNLHEGWLYEPETTRFVARWLRAGDNFLDVGANIGYYTAIGASLVGRLGQVHAFEPYPEVAALLKETIRLNRFTQVHLNEVAVSSADGTILLYRPADAANTYESTVVRREGIALDQIEVGSVTLDSYIAQRHIERVRLLKVDVEGAELAVFSGAANLLAHLPPEAVVCEFAPRILPNPQETWRALLERFDSLNYRPFLLNQRGEPASWDGSMPTWEWGNVCFLAGRTRANQRV